MNKETTELIKQLADKLGTTAEHLWAVLVRQAPISASVDMIVCFILFVIGVAIWALFIGKCRKEAKTEYGIDWDTNGLLLGLCGVATVIIVFVIGMLFVTALSGFFNPEYWALRQLIN